MGVDELLEGGLVDEHGGYGPLALGGVVGAQGVVELDAGRADAPAGAGDGKQSPDGLGGRPGGIGVGVETNGREVVGRGVVVGEGVDRGEAGRRGGSAVPTLGLCPAPGPDRGLVGSAGSGGTRVAGADVPSARCSRLPPVVSSTGAGGWVASTSRPAGAAQVCGRSLDGADGHRARCSDRSSGLASRFPRGRGQRALAEDRARPRGGFVAGRTLPPRRAPRPSRRQGGRGAAPLALSRVQGDSVNLWPLQRPGLRSKEPG